MELQLKKFIYILRLLFYFALFILTCKNPKFQNPCDPNSKAFQDSMIAKALLSDKSSYCGLAGLSSASADSINPTVTIQNLRNGGVVQTGFLIGSSADNVSVSAVEVALDNGIYSTATGTTSWKFKLPIGSSTWKDDSSHKVQVRSKDSSGNYSSVTTLTVKKGQNKDINGDGYADLVVGASGYSGNTGRVYVFHSSGTSGISVTAAGSASAIITGEATSNDFGKSIATGDVNGDGYADVIVGADQYATVMGRVYIFHSGGDAGISASSATSASTTITGQLVGDAFGMSVSSGDINGDGYTDVVVGAVQYNANDGRAYIFHSSGSSGVTITSAASASRLVDGEVGSYFGTVCTGDLNGDGNAELIVGGIFASANAGRVYVFNSSSSGVSITSAASASWTITGEAVSMFGWAIATGDISGDGYTDLIAGSDAYSTSTGRVYIFHSTGTSGLNISSAGSASSVITGETTNTGFGGRISVGDFNGDGYADVTAGATLYGSNAGRAYIFHSTGSSGITITSAGSASTVVSAEASSDLGNVKSADINGDGYSDLFVSGFSYSSSTGRTYILHSTGSTGVTITSVSSASKTITGETTSNNFGNNIALNWPLLPYWN